MTVKVMIGDCREVLPTIPDESVHACITSPPYWGLRDYGVAGQLGLEPTPGQYVDAMVAVFRDVRRVLRKDGTLWLNLGDSYATGAGGVGECPGGGKQGKSWEQRGKMTPPNRLKLPGLKPKDLVGIPWRVAFALQADGWWLRQDIIWSKPNPMPESVRDRCTKAHEYLFLLSKSERYYYDADAIEEDAVTANEAKYDPGTDGLSGLARRTGKTTRRFKAQPGVSGWANGGGTHKAVDHNVEGRQKGAPRGESGSFHAETRNRRSVWTVTTQPFSEAHFATFPPALIEPCILAGCAEGGTVLDPFGGAGTTGLVADRHHRSAILIELNPEYADMAQRRIRGDSPLFAEVT